MLLIRLPTATFISPSETSSSPSACLSCRAVSPLAPTRVIKSTAAKLKGEIKMFLLQSPVLLFPTTYKLIEDENVCIGLDILENQFGYT